MLVNLRVVTEATRRAGADGHVCELQLVLRAFDELRYVQVVSAAVDSPTHETRVPTH